MGSGSTFGYIRFVFQERYNDVIDSQKDFIEQLEFHFRALVPGSSFTYVCDVIQTSV
jgi:hypothetical protein